MPDETRGTVHQLPSGAWRWRVSTGVRLLQPDGTVKRQRRTGTAPTKRAAYQAIDRETKAEPGAGRINPTVAEWVPVWLHEAEHKRHLTPSTLRGYRSMADAWIVPLLGAVPVADVRPKHVTAMMDRMTRDGRLVAKATRNQARNLVSGILRCAMEHGIIEDGMNAARVARTPVGERAKKHHTPDGTELRRALDAATATEGAVAHLLVRLAAITGARRGSLAALRWSDIDGDRLFVGRSVTKLPGVHVEGPTKTGQTTWVPLDPVTLELLEQQRTRLLALDGTAPTWIIADEPGEGWAPDRMTATWRRIRKIAGLPDTRLHDIRHFVGTTAVAEVDAATGGGRLTHSDNSMTLRVYAHPTDAGQVRLTEILAAKLDG